MQHMREQNDLGNVFYRRLENYELKLPEDFWEGLEHDLKNTVRTDRKKGFFLLSKNRRILATAASIALLFASTWLAFWCLSLPEEATKAVFAQMGTEMPIEVGHSNICSSMVKNGSNNANPAVYLNASENGGESTVSETPVSVQFSIMVTQQIYTSASSPVNHEDNAYVNLAQNAYSDIGEKTFPEGNTECDLNACDDLLKQPRWALKASIGTALPKDNSHAPIVANVSLERRLNQRFAMEAGLQYSCLTGEQALHMLGIPVKVSARLAGNDKVDLYALAGGMIEKCISGADDNGFDAEPLQFSLSAGLGIRYKLSDRLALFAEPTVSHHFDNNSESNSLYAQRPTNMNLLCGLRMTY